MYEVTILEEKGCCSSTTGIGGQSQLQKSKPKPMKEIMKFRRVPKPQAYPLRYVEDFGAKYDFIRPSSLKGCSSIGCMLHISVSGKTAWVLPLTKIFASPPMAPATARFVSFATGQVEPTRKGLAAMLWMSGGRICLEIRLGIPAMVCTGGFRGKDGSRAPQPSGRALLSDYPAFIFIDFSCCIYLDEKL